MKSASVVVSTTSTLPWAGDTTRRAPMGTLRRGIAKEIEREQHEKHPEPDHERHGGNHRRANHDRDEPDR